MINKDNVIKGLHEIGNFVCDKVSFEEARKYSRTIDETIELLKEHEKPNGKCANECECWDSAYERGKHDAVVRCKDCKYSGIPYYNTLKCSRDMKAHYDDWYCADGVRKDG